MTLERMPAHLTHAGVHDHGFNNVSTYGNLLRLMNEGRIHYGGWEHEFYVLALRSSGAVQARRWTRTEDGKGYIYSFNGPHSLLVDTIRTLRSLALGHQLGHVLMAENDRPISLLERLLQHAHNTARYSAYYGPGYNGPWNQDVWHPSLTGFYYGIFEAFMPDLNYNNPEVTAEMESVAKFWLEDVGVDGFRLDAAKHLIENKRMQENTSATHEWFKEYRNFYKESNPNAITIGELFGNNLANVDSYTEGDQFDLAFNFELASAIIQSAKSGSALPVLGALNATDRILEPQQYSPFLTNHDQNRVISPLEGNRNKAKVTAAEILDDEVRRRICPDKLTSAQWLSVMETAHGLSLRSTATIMFGHVDQPRHWARHLLRVRDLAHRTGGFTEFIPLPFVHMAAPIFPRGLARKGPTFREAVLMHAVARLALNPVLTNIQVSWVKMGTMGALACLDAGANDLGGTLINESISRAAGAQHGSELAPARMEALIRSLGREPRQRTTLYGSLSQAQRGRSYAAPAPPNTAYRSAIGARRRPSLHEVSSCRAPLRSAARRLAARALCPRCSRSGRPCP